MEAEADCGLNTSGCLAYYDHDTWSWKTYQLSLDGELIEFSETFPSSGMMRNGKLFSRQTLGCLTVENESSLLPTPTKSYGVNARGWGLSKTGRLRYSQQTQDNALRFGYRPPITLLEWMMGFPEGHTAIERLPSETLSSLQPQNGSQKRYLHLIEKFGVVLTETGLELPAEGMAYDQWEAVGHQLCRLSGTWQWWVGDWINFGEKKYGEVYQAVVEATGINSKTARNVASVVSKFEKSRRRDNLTFNHHAEVAACDEKTQDELLDRCDVEGLTTRQLRDIVRELSGIEKPEKPRIKLPDEPSESEVSEVETWLEEQDERTIADRFKALWQACDAIQKAIIRELINELD